MSDEKLINRLYRHVAKYNIVDRLGKEWDGLPSITTSDEQLLSDYKTDVHDDEPYSRFGLSRKPEYVYYAGDAYKYDYWVGKLAELCKSHDELQGDRQALASLKRACDDFAHTFVEWLVNDAVTQTELSLKKIMTAVQKRDSSSIYDCGCNFYNIVAHEKFSYPPTLWCDNLYREFERDDGEKLKRLVRKALQNQNQDGDRERGADDWDAIVYEYDRRTDLCTLIDFKTLFDQKHDAISGYERNTKILLEVLYCVCQRFSFFSAPAKSYQWCAYFSDLNNEVGYTKRLAQTGRAKVLPDEDSYVYDALLMSAGGYKHVEERRVRYRHMVKLRESYKNLIRKVKPLLKDSDCARKARSLYKDMYNFSGLDWDYRGTM